MTTRPAFLGDAHDGDTIAFRQLRIDPDTDMTVRDADGQPVYDLVTGRIASYERVPSRPYPTIRFTLDGSDRVLTKRPDFHITLTR